MFLHEFSIKSLFFFNGFICQSKSSTDSKCFRFLAYERNGLTLFDMGLTISNLQKQGFLLEKIGIKRFRVLLAFNQFPESFFIRRQIFFFRASFSKRQFFKAFIKRFGNLLKLYSNILNLTKSLKAVNPLQGALLRLRLRFLFSRILNFLRVLLPTILRFFNIVKRKRRVLRQFFSGKALYRKGGSAGFRIFRFRKKKPSGVFRQFFKVPKEEEAEKKPKEVAKPFILLNQSKQKFNLRGRDLIFSRFTSGGQLRAKTERGLSFLKRRVPFNKPTNKTELKATGYNSRDTLRFRSGRVLDLPPRLHLSKKLRSLLLFYQELLQQGRYRGLLNLLLKEPFKRPSRRGFDLLFVFFLLIRSESFFHKFRRKKRSFFLKRQVPQIWQGKWMGGALTNFFKIRWTNSKLKSKRFFRGFLPDFVICGSFDSAVIGRECSNLGIPYLSISELPLFSDFSDYSAPLNVRSNLSRLFYASFVYESWLKGKLREKSFFFRNFFISQEKVLRGLPYVKEEGTSDLYRSAQNLNFSQFKKVLQLKDLSGKRRKRRNLFRFLLRFYSLTAGVPGIGRYDILRLKIGKDLLRPEGNPAVISNQCALLNFFDFFKVLSLLRSKKKRESFINQYNPGMGASKFCTAVTKFVLPSGMYLHRSPNNVFGFKPFLNKEVGKRQLLILFSR